MNKRLVAALAVGVMASASCSQAEETHTSSQSAAAPVTSAYGKPAEPVSCGEIRLLDDIMHELIAVPAENGTVRCGQAGKVFAEFVHLPAERRQEASLASIKSPMAGHALPATMCPRQSDASTTDWPSWRSSWLEAATVVASGPLAVSVEIHSSAWPSTL